jgi:hypothetical protein
MKAVYVTFVLMPLRTSSTPSMLLRLSLMAVKGREGVSD